MKKARIMFACLIVLTITSTVLAFNTQLVNGTLFCTSQLGSDCAKDAGGVFIRHAANANGFSSYCSTSQNDCAAVTVLTKVLSDPR